MSTFTAFAVTLFFMPIIGLVVFVVRIPLVMLTAPLGLPAQRTEAFVSQAGSAFLMVAIAHLFFVELKVPFSPGLPIFVGLVLTLFNVSRIIQALKAWQGRLTNNFGLPMNQSSNIAAEAVNDVTWSDETTLKLYHAIGYEIISAVGSIAGVILASVYFYAA